LWNCQQQIRVKFHIFYVCEEKFIYVVYVKNIYVKHVEVMHGILRTLIKLSNRLALFANLDLNMYLFFCFKVREYSKKIELYQQKMLNLTIRVEKMEKTSVSYTELDFQLLKVEIVDLERLVTKLKSSLVGSNVIVEQIYLEVLPQSSLATEASNT